MEKEKSKKIISHLVRYIKKSTKKYKFQEGF